MKRLGLLAVLWVCGWALGAQGTIPVTITADAPNAVLKIDGGVPLTMPVTTTLKVGNHSFEISAPGYKTKNVQVPISGNTSGNLMFKMEKLPGFTLQVNVLNAPDAQILVNNGPFSNGSVLNPGTYLVTVKANGFKDYQQMVNLTQNTVLPISLQSQMLKLTLQVSGPSTYQVLINNGPAQMVNSLNPGTYLVTVKAPGFKDFQQMVNLKSDMVLPVNLESNLLTLTIQVNNVKNYEVFINNGPAKNINSLAAGTYLVTVKAPGFKDFQQMVELKGTMRLPVTLEADNLTLTVQVNNAQTYQVFINNGPAQAVNQLAPGSYLLTVKAPGFKDFQQMVTLKSSMVVPVTLESQGASVNVNLSKLGKNSNARVYVNNVLQKSFPFMAAGTVNIRIEVGPVTFQTTTTLQNGQTYTLTPDPQILVQ